MATVYRINGVDIKKPPQEGFGLESYNLTKSGRVASGKMVIDLVAKKRKFTFKYDVMSGKDMELIKSLIDGNAMFVTFEYMENNVLKSARVYAGAIKRTLFRSDGIWYWKNVAFDLIEQ